MRQLIRRARRWWAAQQETLLSAVFAESAPLDLRIVGRVVFHAALVGLSAGLLGAAFFAALEHVQAFLLEGLTGYQILRASGESAVLRPGAPSAGFRPWLLAVLPALGGLICGLLTRLAPETRGGGGDAMVDAFHRQDGVVRPRVIWVKALASLATLGTGGAGGREGPTMLIGAALGSSVARALGVGARERRILLVAGVAAGISAVFRTPLGAALLAVEVLYRDGYESDALVPSVLASVISYSVVISLFGESTLLSHAPRFPFTLAHLPLYGALALVVALIAALFVSLLRRSRRFFSGLPVPAWVRPALGGLALGVFATPLVLLVGGRVGISGQGLGILGGGYGAVQVAISGAPWLPEGWGSVELLAGLALAKLLAASLTIGSEGSAGDFAPSLAMGGLLGGALGRAWALLLPEWHIDPGAFALVGMGAFYGGIAHVPLAALVLVCELAGNYDLLVPLMLAQAIAFVALRKRTLYESQVPTLRDSPVHRESLLLELLQGIRVREVMTSGRSWVSFRPDSPAQEMLAQLAGAAGQEVFPVVDPSAGLVGLVGADALRVLAQEHREPLRVVAADLMGPPVSVGPADSLRRATELLLRGGLRQLPVLEDGRVVALLDEREVARAHLRGATEPPPARPQVAG